MKPAAIAVFLGCTFALSTEARAQQPASWGWLGAGPNGYGYSGFGYSAPGPRGLGYYTGTYVGPFDGGPSPYYSPIFSAMVNAPGSTLSTKSVFPGDAPSVRLWKRVVAHHQSKHPEEQVPPPRRGPVPR